jgi:hypothetical protein
MCAACRNAAGNGLDYCDEHNNEFCRERSAYADELYREQLRKYGIDEGG